MDERAIGDFQIGELVKWYETCADNIVVFASGTGIVMKRGLHRQLYKIYRTKEKDYKDYSGYYLEGIGKDEQ